MSKVTVGVTAEVTSVDPWQQEDGYSRITLVDPYLQSITYVTATVVAPRVGDEVTVKIEHSPSANDERRADEAFQKALARRRHVIDSRVY